MSSLLLKNLFLFLILKSSGGGTYGWKPIEELMPYRSGEKRTEEKEKQNQILLHCSPAV